MGSTDADNSSLKTRCQRISDVKLKVKGTMIATHRACTYVPSKREYVQLQNKELTHFSTFIDTMICSNQMA